MEAHSPDIAKKLLNRDFANLVARVQKGGKLTRAERAMLQSLVDNECGVIQEADQSVCVAGNPCGGIIAEHTNRQGDWQSAIAQRHFSGCKLPGGGKS